MPSASDVARILSAALSDVGRTRSENQDAFGEFSTPSGERLFVVADGMGGHRGGATASRLCVETLGRAFGDGEEPAQARLRRGFELANARIHDAAGTDAELAGMGTTAVALVLAPDGSGALGWVGDSRAYRFSGGSLERLSTDHSVVGEMMRAGVITEEEAETHPRRNELLRAIGPHDVVEPETIGLRHKPGDRFLLCSDGLWGPVPEAELAIVLGFETPELAVKKLISMANERGGPDNVTAQIAIIADPTLEIGAPVPAFVPRPEPSVRSRTLPLLAGGAAVAAATLIALAVYGLRQGAGTEAAEAPTEQASAPTPPPPPVAEPAPEKIEIAAAPAKPEAAKLAAAPKPAAKKPAPAPKPVAAPAPKPAPKPAPAPKAEPPKPEPPPIAKPVAPEPAVAAVPAPTPAAEPVVVAATEPPAPTPPPEAPVEPQAHATPSRDQVERFLSDWETAISSKDFALYSRLGLPGDEQSFNTHYVDNEAKIDFALQDFDPQDADELVVRVQMVLETKDQTGTRTVDEERSFVVKQTPDGLHYIGAAKK